MSTANEIKAMERRIDAAKQRGNTKAVEEMLPALWQLKRMQVKKKNNGTKVASKNNNKKKRYKK